MKFLQQTQQPWSRFSRWRLHSLRGLLLGLQVAGLVGIELLGRRLSRDQEDLFLLTAFWAMWLVFATTDQYWNLGVLNRPKRWWSGFKAWFIERARQLDCNLGVDFRNSPPVPAKLPPFIKSHLLGLGLLTVGAGLFAWLAPEGLRPLLASRFYLAYLLMLSLLWAGLIAGLLAFPLVTYLFIHDLLVSLCEDNPRRGKRWARGITAAVLAAQAVAFVYLPAWVPLAAAPGWIALSAIAVAAPKFTRLQLLWHRHEEPGQVYSVNYNWLLAFLVAWGALPALAVMLLTGGQLLTAGQVSPAMPLTEIVSRLFGILAMTGVGGYCLFLVHPNLLAMFSFSPRIEPPTLFVHQPPAADVWAALRQELWLQGWKTRVAPQSPRPLDVQVVWRERDQATILETDWPRPVSAETIIHPEVQFQLRRRDAVQKRRALVSGLEKLWKRAARKNFQNGNGYWIGLQYWFIKGLSRDVDDTEFRENEPILMPIIGPMYYQVFPQAVRHHWYQIMSALQIDLMFVEDGISFKRFRNVLRVCFETYDMHNGERRAEELHFTGLPGVRVIIHEYDISQPLESSEESIYPEPDYREISRARLLHVFKDREEDEELSETPFDWEGQPLLSSY